MNSTSEEDNLQEVIRLGQVDSIQDILDKSNLEQKELCKLLHYAAFCGQVEIVRILITKYKCPVDCRDENKQTSLHTACSQGHLNVVKILVSKHKAGLNTHDKENDTPLNKAALGGHSIVVKCLIDEFSCSQYVKGFEGRTILHQACDTGNVDLAEMLLMDYNLDPFSSDDDGVTPLHIAAGRGREALVTLLITKYNGPVDCRNKSEQTPLHLACSEGHIRVVRILVTEHKADLNARNKYNDTPLNKAAFGGHVNIVKCLIDEFSCSQYVKGFEGRTILHQACDAGNVDLAEMLLMDYNLDPFSSDNNGNTPLHIAALCGREALVTLLITKYKCPVDFRNKSEQTPLHLACSEGHIRVVRILVTEHKADLNARGRDNNTPLNRAALGGHANVVKCLIDKFGCIQYVRGFKDRTILHQACDAGNVDLTEMLLMDYNLDPFSSDNNGNTPLHIAALSGREALVTLLITKYECPVDCRNKSEGTPLHHACSKGHIRVVRILVTEHKADLNARGRDNYTPLNEAALGGHANVVKCLIDEFSCSQYVKGFKDRTILHQACDAGNVELAEMLLMDYNLDPFSSDDNGNTPLHIAALSGREALVTLLITKYKCPVDCRNKRERTPLHQACRKGHIRVVRILVSEHKADLNARGRDNNTPLNEAALGGHANVVKCLIDEFSCSQYVKGFKGRIILHQACSFDRIKLTELLVEFYDLSLLSTDKDGNTPLHVAAMYKSSKSVQVLLQKYSAPVYYRNNAGRTALDVASSASIKNIIKEYLKVEHKRILFDYKRLQELSSKKYSGAQKLTRVFVVGNVGSGKSTLIESLKSEGFFSSWITISESTVPPHTSGIVPSVYYSKVIGRILFYDFAGDPEYYSSHSAVLSTIIQAKFGTNIFLIVTCLNKDSKLIQEELGYWFSFLSYHGRDVSLKHKVLVIGSHADLVTDSESGKTVDRMQKFVQEYSSRVSTLNFAIRNILKLNCRQPQSSRLVRNDINQLLEGTTSYQLTSEAAVLLGLLESDFKSVVTCKLSTILTHIEETGIALPKVAERLYRFVRELHILGLLMMIRGQRGRMEEHLLILNVSKVTNEVHELLFSNPSSHLAAYSSSDSYRASMGILPTTYLERILPEYMTTDCLIQLQYCHEFSYAEVRFDHSVVPTVDPNVPTLLYFPGLCTAERKKSIITPEHYKYNIGWFAECQSKFDYFPSRYLHVLLLRLAFSFAHPVAPCETEGETDAIVDLIKSNCGCTMWKNGIHWHMEEGVECMVELVNNCKGLVVVTKSTTDQVRIYKCAEMLFKIINLAMEAKEEFCHTITLKQYLMPLNADDISSFSERENLFDLKDVARVLKEGKAVVLNVSKRQPVETSKLAHLKRHLLTGHEPEHQILKEQSAKSQSIGLREQHHSRLLQKLTIHSVKWKEVGSLLGFLPHELDIIQAKPSLWSNAPNSWLNAMLAEWLQWAPGDSRESTNFATLEGLREALCKAGLVETAQSLDDIILHN